MNDTSGSPLSGLEVRLAGRAVADVWDRVSRYCGLPWSGGVAETWAFAYYDAIESDTPDDVGPVDVLAAASLHPGLTRDDLAWFVDHRSQLSLWLRSVPVDVSLAELELHEVDLVKGLADLSDGVSVALLSKVLHRKRPEAVPLLDGHVVDWYRPVTGERSGVRAYPAVVDAMRRDLIAGADCGLRATSAAVLQRTGRQVSLLRVADIALWMGARR